MRIFLILLISGLLLIACKPQHQTSQSTALHDNNNLITVTQSANSTTPSGAGNDQIIFEGINNVVEVIQENSWFFDEAHDVIIIRGDGNLFKLYNINVVSLKPGEGDTIIMTGNNQRYVVDVRNVIITSNGNLSVDTLEMKTPSFNEARYASDFGGHGSDEELILIDYFDERVTPQYAFSFFSAGIKSGNAEHYYQLAELYLYGIGTEPSTGKAVELYEYAAVRDYVPAIRKLGDICSGTFGYKPSSEKAQYYYKRGSVLGDSYCTERVKE